MHRMYLVPGELWLNAMQGNVGNFVVVRNCGCGVSESGERNVKHELGLVASFCFCGDPTIEVK